MDISVVIACYNRIELLKLTVENAGRAIEGLNAEIILVDDGSEPAISSQLHEPEYKALPLKFIRHVNSGLVYSKYVGMMASQGRYIQFLDSDDHIAPDKLTKQVTAMDAQSADVSYTDLLTCDFTDSNELIAREAAMVKFSERPPEFYIGVQPAPHSPVFRRSYLLNYLTEPFIPVNRVFDSIGEVWMYYNLAVYPAKIIKVDEPLTFIVHHTQERITNCWENLGLSALAIKKTFSKRVPNAMHAADAKRCVGQAAFNSFRGLPYNIDFSYQYELVKVWRQLGASQPIGGSNYKFLSKLFGPVPAAVMMKLLLRKNYNKIRTIADADFKKKLKKVFEIEM